MIQIAYPRAFFGNRLRVFGTGNLLLATLHYVTLTGFVSSVVVLALESLPPIFYS
jgi:hypothetical protein